MNWMIIAPMTGGAIAAYFAYPYGFLAACLAFFVGGLVLAALELSRQLLLLKSNDNDCLQLSESKENDAPSRLAIEGSSISSQKLLLEANSTSPDRTRATRVFQED